MEVATIKGANANPGAPRGWTEENGPCGTLPILYQRDAHGNEECISAWKPTEDELRQLNDGGFVLLSVIGWQVPVCVFTCDKDGATEGRGPRLTVDNAEPKRESTPAQFQPKTTSG